MWETWVRSLGWEDPWVGKIPWRREQLPTPVFWLENSMDRGAWQATLHGVAKSRVRHDWSTFTFKPSALFVLRSQGLEHIKFNQRKCSSGETFFLAFNILLVGTLLTRSLPPVLRENSLFSSLVCFFFFLSFTAPNSLWHSFPECQARLPASWAQGYHLITIHRCNWVGLFFFF